MRGFIEMADMSLTFECDETHCTYTVQDTLTGAQEDRTVTQPAFLKALAIAVHNDGMPNVEADYPDAESVQPTNPGLRWIP